MNDIVAKAAWATTTAEDEIELALAALNQRRHVLSVYGVYRERMPVAESLEVARQAITRALDAIARTTPWPGPADY